MGYYLEAIICQQQDAADFTSLFTNAKAVPLEQGFCLIPMSEALHDEINPDNDSSAIAPFTLLTKKTEQVLLPISFKTTIAYVEAEYFGGQGAQSAIVWATGKRMFCLPGGQQSINETLRYMGVVKEGGRDEFNTLNLGKHRRSLDWLS